MTDEQIQKEILLILNKERLRSFSQSLDEEDLAQRTGSTWAKIRHVVDYLEQKGYIGSKNKQRGSRLYRTFSLTPKGIDRLEGKEDTGAFAVGGDYVNITVGNNAQNLALGKEITQQQQHDTPTALAKKLDSTLHDFIAYLETEGKDTMDGEQIMLLTQQVAALRTSLITLGLI